ncbi:conserved hypothetical protein [Burkholderia vietnamiensis]|nr:conserved hypothetical protein [Burkholderia vietnamiensis]
MDSVDSRPVAARSVLHPAGADGRVDVRADEPEPDAAGPGPGEDDEVHADRVLGDVLLLPGRPGAVLRREQRAVDRAAVLHHAQARRREEEAGLTPVARAGGPAARDARKKTAWSDPCGFLFWARGAGSAAAVQAFFASAFASPP